MKQPSDWRDAWVVFKKEMQETLRDRRTLIISFTATAVITLWVIFTGSMWGLYIFALVYGFCWGALAVLRFSTTAEVFGLGSVGLIMGLLGFSESMAATVGSYFGGFIFDIDGSYRLAFILCVIISIIGMILSWRLKPVRSSHQ